MTAWLGVSLPWLLAGLAFGTLAALWTWYDVRRQRRAEAQAIREVAALRAAARAASENSEKSPHIRIHRGARGNGHAVNPWNVTDGRRD